MSSSSSCSAFADGLIWFMLVWFRLIRKLWGGAAEGLLLQPCLHGWQDVAQGGRQAKVGLPNVQAWRRWWNLERLHNNAGIR